jgi:hypothetical protein
VNQAVTDKAYKSRNPSGSRFTLISLIYLKKSKKDEKACNAVRPCKVESTCNVVLSATPPPPPSVLHSQVSPSFERARTANRVNQTGTMA